MATRFIARSFPSLKTNSSLLSSNFGSIFWQRNIRFASSSTSPTANTSGQGEVDELLSSQARENVKITSSTQPEATNNHLGDGTRTDWSRSYFGLSTEPFAKEIADVLQAPVEPLDVEIKPGTSKSFSATSNLTIVSRWIAVSARNKVSPYT